MEKEESQCIKTHEKFILNFEVKGNPPEKDTLLVPQDLVWIIWEYYDRKYYILCDLCGNLTFPLTFPMDCKHKSFRKCESCQSFAISRIKYFKLNVGDPAGIILEKEYWMCETTSCKENGLIGIENVVNQCFSCSQKIFTLFQQEGMKPLTECLSKINPLKTDWSEESLNEEAQLINKSMSLVCEFLKRKIKEKEEKNKQKSAATLLITTNPLRFVPCPKCRRLFHFSRMIINESDYGCPFCVC